MEANEGERRRWNDERWTSAWPLRERLTDEVTSHLLAAAEPREGERALDIGCGGGKTSLAAARLVGPDGLVVGADISAPLTGLARQRAAEAEVGNVVFRVHDVQSDRIEGAPFDLAISQFGVMFFDEPARAFANIRAQLVPGGRLCFACWQPIERNPWFFSRAVAHLIPPPPTPPEGKSPTGPFSLADRDRTAGLLEAAGFTDVRHTAHEIAVDVPEASVVDEEQLIFMGVPPEHLAEALEATERHMRQFRLSDELSRFPLAFQIFRAGAP